MLDCAIDIEYMPTTCKLCLQPADLRYSHIIPEWCYRPTYDEKHRALVKRPEIEATELIQKGWRERLLCQACEARVCKWESWFAEFWNVSPALPATIPGRDASFYLMRGVDYDSYKLFHLSILWRASVANRGEFDSVSLGPYEEKLRRMLLAGDPGPEHHYPLYGTVLTKANGSVARGLVTKPQKAKLRRVTAYYAALAGCEWTWFASHRPNCLDTPLKELVEGLSVRRGQPLRLWVRPLAASNTMRMWRESVTSAPSPTTKVPHATRR